MLRVTQGALNTVSRQITASSPQQMTADTISRSKRNHRRLGQILKSFCALPVDKHAGCIAAQVMSVAQAMEWVMLDSLRDQVTWE